jgi:hypothetical protein
MRLPSGLSAALSTTVLMASERLADLLTCLGAKGERANSLPRLDTPARPIVSGVAATAT